jgi:hypothetical protein
MSNPRSARSHILHRNLPSGNLDEPGNHRIDLTQMDKDIQNDPDASLLEYQVGLIFSILDSLLRNIVD